MPTEEKSEQQATDEPSPEVREILLSRKVWTEAIHRLDREKTRLLQEVDSSQPNAKDAVRLRLMQIEHETAMYEICLDRAHERAGHSEGGESPEITHRRERFYRLMRGLAKAGNERAAQADRNAFITCGEGQEGWSPDRWVTEMEAVASEARKQLIASIAS